MKVTTPFFTYEVDDPPEPFTPEELRVLIFWPEGTVGWEDTKQALITLDALAQKQGYGGLAQLAQMLADVKCYGRASQVKAAKIAHSKALGWPLPTGWE